MRTKEFLQALSTFSDSKATWLSYGQALFRFEAFLKERGLRINQVVRSTIIDYIEYLKTHTGRIKGDALAPASINLNLAALSMYFDWDRGENEDRRPNPVALIKRPRIRKRKPNPVDEGVLTELIDGITDSRDKALILCFLYSGLRLHEMTQLNRDSITLRRHLLPDGSSEYYGEATVIGKGNKSRDFIVGPPAVIAIRAYLKESRAADALPPLFLSSRKTRLSCRAIEQVLAKWCDRLNIDHLHPHRLRHSFATRNLDAGMTFPVIARLMGHGSITVTEGYTEIPRARQKREYFAAMEQLRSKAAA